MAELVVCEKMPAASLELSHHNHDLFATTLGAATEAFNRCAAGLPEWHG